jgi:hypothetical protein
VTLNHFLLFQRAGLDRVLWDEDVYLGNDWGFFVAVFANQRHQNLIKCKVSISEAFIASFRLGTGQ